MICLHLRNHDKFISILAYNPKSGNHIEFINKSSVQSDTWIGSYVRSADGTIVGIYASPHGPMLFYGKERFDLALKVHRATVNDIGDLRKFTLYNHEKPVLSILYNPPKYYDYDCWSDEATVDFFLSTKQALESEHFFDFYTRDYISELQ